MRRALPVIVAVLALLGAPTLHAGETPPASTVTLLLSTVSVEYGDVVVATGRVEPATSGVEVVIAVVDGATSIELANTVTDGLGGFAVRFQARHGGQVQAEVAGSQVESGPTPLEVVPRIRLRVRPGAAFLGAKVKAAVWPVTYTGTVALTVSRRGTVVGRVTAQVANGHLRVTAPTPGVGRFRLSAAFPAFADLRASTVTAKLRATARTLSPGSSGRELLGLTRRLAELHVRVPGPSSYYSSSLLDSVYAFQKAYGLPRTGVVGPETWRKLGTAKLLRPRYRGPVAHIEVDKTRQILLDVREGKVAAVIPVSSGATGNTPEGKHAIRWKALATTTWLGPAILYRTMTFYGNSFAIHGFPSVPPYPASHGCVRIPIWTADWLYERSSVGETVYVYS